jgi:hypothetical protein
MIARIPRSCIDACPSALSMRWVVYEPTQCVVADVLHEYTTWSKLRSPACQSGAAHARVVVERGGGEAAKS